MRALGSVLRNWAVAPGLALMLAAGVASAQVPPDPAPNKPVTGATQGVSGTPNVSNIAPTNATSPTAAQPHSMLLAMDGAPPMAPTPGIGQPVDGVMRIQPQVTRNGQFARWMHDAILFPLISIVSLFVLALLVWVILRYRQRANREPSKTSHNTFIEVVWTLAPVLILAAIAIPSIGLLQAQFKPAPAGAVTLKAVGNQWYWSYTYPDNGGFEITANMLKEKDQVGKGERARTDADGPRLLAADNRVVLPVGVPIRLITTSADVIHSWAVPAFWLKLDAVPGRLNETSFTIERPGLYFGQCSELCGARHGFMPIAVEAVPPAVFAAWVKAKGGTMPAPGKPSGKIIPQLGAPGSAASDVDAKEADSFAGPTENGTHVADQPSKQGATGNPAGAGNAGH